MKNQNYKLTVGVYGSQFQVKPSTDDDGNPIHVLYIGEYHFNKMCEKVGCDLSFIYRGFITTLIIYNYETEGKRSFSYVGERMSNDKTHYFFKSHDHKIYLFVTQQ